MEAGDSGRRGVEGERHGARPAAAEGLDEADGVEQALGGQLRGAPLGGEHGALGVDDLEVGDVARVVARLRQFAGAPGRGDRAFLRGRLVGEQLGGGEAVLHLAEGDEHALAEEGDALVVGGAAAREVGAVAAALEDRQVEARADGPQARVALEQPVEVAGYTQVPFMLTAVDNPTITLSTSDSAVLLLTALKVLSAPSRLAVTPVADGHAVVILTVTENGVTFSQSIALDVSAGKAFVSWRASNFTAGEAADDAISGPNAIYAGDGLTNLAKYTLGLNSKLPVSGVGQVALGATDWQFTYTHPAGTSGVTYVVEMSWGSPALHCRTCGSTRSVLGISTRRTSCVATFASSVKTVSTFCCGPIRSANSKSARISPDSPGAYVGLASRAVVQPQLDSIAVMVTGRRPPL